MTWPEIWPLLVPSLVMMPASGHAVADLPPLYPLEMQVAMARETGEIDLGYLCTYMGDIAAALAPEGGVERVEHTKYLGEDRPGYRSTYEFDVPKAGAIAQVRSRCL